MRGPVSPASRQSSRRRHRPATSRARSPGPSTTRRSRWRTGLGRRTATSTRAGSQRKRRARGQGGRRRPSSARASRSRSSVTTRRCSVGTSWQIGLARRHGWPSTTRGCKPRSSVSSPTSAPRGRASSRRPIRPAGSSSATCTTGRNSACSPSPTSSASPSPARAQTASMNSRRLSRPLSRRRARPRPRCASSHTGSIPQCSPRQGSARASGSSTRRRFLSSSRRCQRSLRTLDGEAAYVVVPTRSTMLRRESLAGDGRGARARRTTRRHGRGRRRPRQSPLTSLADRVGALDGTPRLDRVRPRGDPMRVVVAEDTLLTREGIVHLLRDAGIDVVAEAENAEQCSRTSAARARTPPSSTSACRPPTPTRVSSPRSRSARTTRDRRPAPLAVR